jgi:multisubunit Na+/H+ antiporter MnhF subunit
MVKQRLFTQVQLKLLMIHTIAYAIAVLALVLSIKELLIGNNTNEQAILFFTIGIVMIFLIAWLHYYIETEYFKRFDNEN